mgnify:CR=1 FL=1
MNKKFRLEIFKRASLCRNFEDQVIVNVNNKNITTPVYVSAGQELISSTISTILPLAGPHAIGRRLSNRTLLWRRNLQNTYHLPLA